MRVLLDKGADIEARMQSMQTWQPTALLLAIDQRLTPVALLLIERGADVNAQTGDTGGDQRQLSALMRAAREGLAEVVAALLAKGAVVDARNQNGNSALMEAALSVNPSFEAARLLLAGGADVNADQHQPAHGADVRRPAALTRSTSRSCGSCSTGAQSSTPWTRKERPR